MSNPGTPAGAGPDSAPAGTGAADAGKGNASGTGIDAHLEPLRKQLEGIQSLIGRFGNELGTLRKQIQPGAGRQGVQPSGFVSIVPDDEMDPTQREVQSLRQEVEEARQERGLDRFLRVSGVSPKDFEEIMQRLNANEAVYHRYDKQGRLDYGAAYMDVWKDIRLERQNAAGQAGSQQRVEEDRQRQEQAQQAQISGVGAGGTVQDGAPLDVSKMSSEEYLKKVLVPAGLVSQDDPPNPAPYGG